MPYSSNFPCQGQLPKATHVWFGTGVSPQPMAEGMIDSRDPDGRRKGIRDARLAKSYWWRCNYLLEER